MYSDHAALSDQFREMSDEELLSRFGSGTLTESAIAIAAAEIRRRGMKLPTLSEPELPDPGEYAGDYEIVARFLNVLDAHVMCGCLQAAGIPAILADAQLVQTNSLWAPALGGARLMVPASHLAAAKEVIAAFDGGALALRDDDEPM